MKVPPAPPTAPARPQIDPTMLAMAAAVMQQQGRFDVPREMSKTEMQKFGIEVRRDMEDMKGRFPPEEPKGVPLRPDNEWVPSNKGLLAPWNRRT